MNRTRKNNFKKSRYNRKTDCSRWMHGADAVLGTGVIGTHTSGEHVTADIRLPAPPIGQSLRQRAGTGEKMVQPPSAQSILLIPRLALGCGPVVAVPLGHSVPHVPTQCHRAHVDGPSTEKHCLTQRNIVEHRQTLWKTEKHREIL